MAKPKTKIIEDIYNGEFIRISKPNRQAKKAQERKRRLRKFVVNGENKTKAG